MARSARLQPCGLHACGAVLTFEPDQTMGSTCITKDAEKELDRGTLHGRVV